MTEQTMPDFKNVTETDFAALSDGSIEPVEIATGDIEPATKESKPSLWQRITDAVTGEKVYSPETSQPSTMPELFAAMKSTRAEYDSAKEKYIRLESRESSATERILEVETRIAGLKESREGLIRDMAADDTRAGETLKSNRKELATLEAERVDLEEVLAIITAERQTFVPVLQRAHAAAIRAIRGVAHARYQDAMKKLAAEIRPTLVEVIGLNQARSGNGYGGDERAVFENLKFAAKDGSGFVLNLVDEAVVPSDLTWPQLPDGVPFSE